MRYLFSVIPSVQQLQSCLIILMVMNHKKENKAKSITHTHTQTHINKGSQKCQADVTVYQGTQQRPQLHTLLPSMQINCIVQCIDLYGEIVKSY